MNWTELGVGGSEEFIKRGREGVKKEGRKGVKDRKKKMKK